MTFSPITGSAVWNAGQCDHTGSPVRSLGQIQACLSPHLFREDDGGKLSLELKYSSELSTASSSASLSVRNTDCGNHYEDYFLKKIIQLGALMHP